MSHALQIAWWTGSNRLVASMLTTVSCQDREPANNAFIETLREEYESVFEDGSGKLKVQRGKVLKYLGMPMDFTTAGQVEGVNV